MSDVYIQDNMLLSVGQDSEERVVRSSTDDEVTKFIHNYNRCSKQMPFAADSTVSHCIFVLTPQHHGISSCNNSMKAHCEICSACGRNCIHMFLQVSL